MTTRSSAKIGTVTFTGKSGNTYEFGIYLIDTSFKKNYGAVYFITRRYKKTDGGHSHKEIYVGQTSDLSERFDDHHKWDCFVKNGANCACIYGEGNELVRLRIEQDLIKNYDPPCNG
ncbi:MAG: hypothetical protein WCX61_05290 [Candidatus Peribacteraceae bacterium]|jgi:hypothetical protein